MKPTDLIQNLLFFNVQFSQDEPQFAEFTADFCSGGIIQWRYKTEVSRTEVVPHLIYHLFIH